MLTATSRAADFPALAGIHYLNTAAESIPPLCVGQALEAYWRDKQQGMHGRHAHFAAVEQCREVAARMVGLATNEVSFCSCSSEAYNLLASALQLKATDEVVINDLDFPAGATPWLTCKDGPAVKLWAARSGQLIIDDLVQLLTTQTGLVQLSLVSFFNGHRVDLDRVIAAVRERAPNAILSLDVTQGLGRVPVQARDVDIVISSTHKWTLGIHGGCVIGIPSASASRLTTQSGGWYHIDNAFAADRFHRAQVKTGAASYSVGMPNFAAIYALNAALRYVESVSIEAIGRHADPLVATLDSGLRQLGMTPMCPLVSGLPTGIVAIRHDRSDGIHSALLEEHVHVMHHAGRLRFALHGYNTLEDVQKLLSVLARFA